MTSTPPAWLEVRGNNNRGIQKEEFGFTCLVWSLCGTTLKAHWFQNAARAVADVAPGLRMMPVHHGEWLKWLRVEDGPIAFLKLDGDSVGAVFQATPVPRRPYLSMELSRLVLTRVMAATKAVVAQHVYGKNIPAAEGDTPAAANKEAARNKLMPQDTRDIPLPADMVYVGGDDIFFCLPESSVATFLAGFSAPVADDHPEQWRGLTFTFSCVTLPSALELNPSSEQMQDANLLASKLVGEVLKNVAKKGGEESLEQVATRILSGKGFTCERWHPDLRPFAGAIDPSVVSGLHIRMKAP